MGFNLYLISSNSKSFFLQPMIEHHFKNKWGVVLPREMGCTFYLHHIRSCASSAPGSSHGSSFCSAQPFSEDGDLNSGGLIFGLANSFCWPVTPGNSSGVTSAVTSGVASVNRGGINLCLANTSAGTPGIASSHPALHDVGEGVNADLGTLLFLLLAVLVRLPCKATSGCSCDASKLAPLLSVVVLILSPSSSRWFEDSSAASNYSPAAAPPPQSQGTTVLVCSSQSRCQWDVIGGSDFLLIQPLGAFSLNWCVTAPFLQLPPPEGGGYFLWVVSGLNPRIPFVSAAYTTAPFSLLSPGVRCLGVAQSAKSSSIPAWS